MPLSKHTFFPIIASLLFFQASAQLCNGSLGDPVVNITFGTGSNPGVPLASNVTNYTYIGNTCPNDGYYTIASSSTGCFGSTWHSLSQDHTPDDANGYMMIVNASVTPGVFYLDTVRNLCGGTTYEFSAWLLNMLRSSACGGAGIMPNITFSIETVTDSVLQTYSTGNIPNTGSPDWKQYGFYFTIPPQFSSVVLRMTNNAPGGCGNDLALDDITFRPCGPKVSAAFANISGINDTAYYCFTDKKTISISGSVQAGYINPAYQWQQSIDSGKNWTDIFGATSNSYTKTFSTPGVFEYRLTSAESGNIGTARCRVASNVLTMSIDNIPVPGATNTSPVCVQEAVTLSAFNGFTYNWSGPSGFSSALASPALPSATTANAGKYYVTVSTRGGCSNRDSTTVIVSPLPQPITSADVSICEKSSTVLSASGGLSYVWTPAKGLSDPFSPNPVASPDSTTLYTVVVKNQFNCKASDSIKVTVLTRPVAHAGPDKQITEGESVVLEGSMAGDTSSHYWTPAIYINNPLLLKPTVNPVSDFTYTLHVASGNGCGTASDDVFVRVFKKISIPNAFSPNGDGINDTWNVDALDSYPESENSVFNRYGQRVFYSRGYSRPWDGRYNGKPVPVGTYYYVIDRKNNFPLLSGSLLIVR
jgi:gliding motility-associated-like protein